MNPNEIERIVKSVVKAMSTQQTTTSSSSNGIFSTMEEAVEQAYIAQKSFRHTTLEQRRQLTDCFRQNSKKIVKELSERVVTESKMGRVEDKILKLNLVIEKTPGVEDLRTGVCTGDNGLTLVELSPFGVIGSLTPVTNPTETILCNAIGMLAAGNTVVFAPHPSAIKTSVWYIEQLNKWSQELGFPPNLITTIEKTSIEAIDYLMDHPKINMLCITGGTPTVVKGLKSGKKTIGAGAGNPPVIVDETADVEAAAKHIFNGASFDNNMPCIAEKVILAVDSIADYLMFNFEKENIFKVTDKEQIKLLEKAVVTESWDLQKDCVGKDAIYILNKAGIPCDYDPRLIIVETDAEHVFAVEELMMPLIPFVRCKDFDDALEKAIDLEGGRRHTAMMHSKNVDRLTLAARMLQTTIFVKNAPSYSGIGFEGEGYTTFTIAGPTGEGLTSAKDFARVRRCVLKDGFSIR